MIGLFIDGGNTGGAVVDHLTNLGYNPIEVTFGARAHDPVMYRYVMDEIWGKMRKAIKGHLVLPERTSKYGQEIYDQLTSRQFGYTLKQQLALESKTDMKARGVTSPDIPDALAVTFYQDVASKLPGDMQTSKPKVSSEYDPYAEVA